MQAIRQDQGVVLIGFLDLLAAPLRAQHQQAHLLLYLGGDHQGEGLGDQLLVDGGDELHQKQGMDPLGKQGADELLLLPGHCLQGRLAVCPGDAQGQHMGVGGEESQHLGQVQYPRHLLPLPDDQPLDAVAGHQQQGVEQIAALCQADQRRRGQHRQRRRQGQPLEGQGMEQGLAGGEAQAAVSGGIEQAICAPAGHGFAGGKQTGLAVQLQGRLQVAGVDAGQDEFRQVLLPELAAALLLSLTLGQGGGEIVCEGGVRVAQPQEGVAGDQLAESVLQGAETMAAAAVELGAHIEHVPHAIVAEGLMGPRLFHRALDDEVEAGGLIPGLLHRLAGAKVADAEALAEPFTGRLAQAVKGRAGKIEQK